MAALIDFRMHGFHSMISGGQAAFISVESDKA